MSRKAVVKSPLIIGICSALLAAGSTSAYAARAHVHGEGELSIAIEDGRVDLSLIAPEADVKNSQEESQEALEARFSDPGLFSFEGAACQLISSSVGYADDAVVDWSEPEAHDHEEQHDHDGHDDHDGHHDHADHHDHDEDHHQHEEEDHSGHADSLLTWTFQCSSDPTRLTIDLFAQTGLSLIRVQAIGESGASTADATADEASFSLP